MTDQVRFHPIIAGQPIPGDWFPGRVPATVVAGARCVIDSSFCFKHFYSTVPGGLTLGDDVTLWRTALSADEQATIAIGNHSYIANASLVCMSRISIGARVLIAGGVTIVDSDFHPLAPAARLADTIALSTRGDRTHRPPLDVQPVIIEDDVWIGWNATVLKGVHIGAGAVIQPGAVVTRNVAAGTVVGGNPARLVDE